ncbi:hypothetical protein OEZ85_010424 [Tetradesmus obliquus]|uniref:CUB domain-containing protein n=1 Tax=Tetradesmus obliquus TaxID=3088 RepID=A0ABY8TM89_TETOB|nr:hypothetical protein OEZ85_010424 [Tetradesmus obliquus]
MSSSGCLVLLAELLLIAGATARPIRQLQQNTVVNFVPTGAGCELKTSVTAEKSHSHSWFNNGPVITGQVTLLNPKEYGIPVSNVQVTAQSSDGQLYTAYADCGSGSPSTYVPSNPVPYTYGEAICTYRIQLDSRVFGSAAPASSNSGSGSGSSGQPIQVGYFPSNNNNNNPYYYPSRPTWSVTAITTIGMTNAHAIELQGAQIGGSSTLSSSRRLLQQPARQGGLLAGLTTAAQGMFNRGGQPGTAPAPAAAAPGGNALTDMLTGAGRNIGATGTNGALTNLMTPQNMQALQGAATRMMGAGRKLAQWGSRADQRMANNMRASVATSQAIEEAVSKGGSMSSTRRAGSTGSLMSWAASQEDQRVFNVAERFARTG